MASRVPDPSPSGAKEADAVEGLAEELARLKQQILESRAASIKEKLVKNNKLVVTISEELICASSSRDGEVDHGESNNMLTVRKRSSLYTLSGSEMGVGEKDIINAQEEVSSSSIIFGSSNGGKCTVHVIKLPRVETIPRYATWIYLNRNQRMADDQSVLGRRQIYYDQDKHGSETLICSDSEGELIEPEEERFNFSDGQDQLLWKALHDYGTNPEVLHVLRQFIDASTSEIEERYEILLKRQQMDDNTCSRASSENGYEIFIDKNHKTLASAMDSYDNLFCRRCLVFDCRTHGCSQNLIFPSEKLPFSTEPEERGKPCSNECYLHLCLLRGSYSSKLEPGKQPVLGEGRSDDEQCKSRLISTIDLHDGISATLLASKKKRKTFDQEHESFDKEDIGINGGMLLGTDKKQSNLLNTNVTIDSANLERMNAYLPKKAEHLKFKSQCGYPMQENASKSLTGSELNTSIGFGDVNMQNALNVEVRSFDGSLGDTGISDHFGRHYPKTWNPFEKDLYLKGVEIFGKNSCLIARNLLSGMKTCVEVADYMYNNGINMSNRSLQDKSLNVAAVFHYMEQEIPARARILRRRGRARKLKYTWKSAGYSSVRKRIADGKERCKQYVPCECQLMCSKQCPCVENANCCEKYCGCSKSCKNRFRGCHCAKSQCRSRQCPCFAAGRECDPDVCRNCWVSCGDQLLGSPPAHGDGYQCGNMKLLLKQQQRILLGRSDVAGWGVFIKNPVNKNDYLGEYTGELISHKEADKRGKVYDRANSSFLFDLNDEFVLDACRKGDKLKFANHSSNPNCYAKIMLVAGDHRVGIFANEHIDPGEELFYDYRYGPDEAPPWARKPEGSKKDDPSASQSRRISKAA